MKPHKYELINVAFTTFALACVAWRFCRAGRTSGVALALARLYYLERPTKTAMLRRLPLLRFIPHSLLKFASHLRLANLKNNPLFRPV